MRNSFEELIRKKVYQLLLIFPIYLSLGDLDFTFRLLAVYFFINIFASYYSNQPLRETRVYRVSLWERVKLNPAQLVILSFSLLIVFGTVLIMTPLAHKESLNLDFIDALFMATSATCVTGLSTFSIGEELTLFGQVCMLVLIQVGGLGIMTLTSSMTILLGRTMGMKDQILMKGLLDISSFEELVSMILEIIKLTLMIEFWGAILLSGAFLYEGQEIGEALFNGIFHSISAFCNAGFSLFPNSLELYKTNVFVNFVVVALIVFGGLGFFVIKDLRENFKKKGFKGLSLHSKIVLYANFFLIILGTFSFFFSEFLNVLDSYSLSEKMLISFFQSITTRTAGFNTISFEGLHSQTIYFIALLMFVGASPGSTGGGIKTTTFALLMQSVKASLMRRKQVEFFNRKISHQLSVRATAIFIISLTIVSLFLLMLVKVEKDIPFLSLFFETISAFGTVGLSLGITPDLGPVGKALIIGLMFIGRVGPFTLVLAFTKLKTVPDKVQFAEGRVMIG